MISYGNNNELGQGIFGIILGLLIIMYGYFKIKKANSAGSK